MCRFRRHALGLASTEEMSRNAESQARQVPQYALIGISARKRRRGNGDDGRKTAYHTNGSFWSCEGFPTSANSYELIRMPFLIKKCMSGHSRCTSGQLLAYP
jgi:hypothetical protein